MDPTVQVAGIGIITTLIATSGVVLAAVVNNKRERSGAASSGIEQTLRERITLRDERIEDLQEDKARLQLKLDEALALVEEKTLLVHHMRKALAECENEKDEE